MDWEVFLPIVGTHVVRVEADSEDDAINSAMNTQFTNETLVQTDACPTRTTGSRQAYAIPVEPDGGIS